MVCCTLRAYQPNKLRLDGRRDRALLRSPQEPSCLVVMQSMAWSPSAAGIPTCSPSTSSVSYLCRSSAVHGPSAESDDSR